MKRIIESRRAEHTEYSPPVKLKKSDLPHGRTVSRMIIDTMEVGECLRINHDDLRCWANRLNDGTVSVYSCSLVSMLSLAKSYEHKQFEHYHEDRYIAVVRRLK